MDATGHPRHRRSWSLFQALDHELECPVPPGLESLEYICQENNADLKHLVGK
jgi:hypothetical protein